MGKTHLAVALGIEAVRAGLEVRFVDCARPIEDLEDAALRAALDDHHHRRGDRRLGQGVRGRRGGERDRGQGVPPLPPGQDNRQVLQAEGPAGGRARQGVTGIGEKTLAQPVKPPLRER